MSLNYLQISETILYSQLSLPEKILIALAMSFTDKGLSLGNDQLAKILSMTPRYVSDLISKLKSENLLKVVSPKSRYRRIYLAENPEVENLLRCLTGTTTSNNRNYLVEFPEQNIKEVKKEEEESAKDHFTIFTDYWKSKGNLPGIKTFTDHRKNKLQARMQEPLFAEHWQEIIDKLSASSFCTGDNGRGWKADVDWLLKNSDNYVKVFENKYNQQQIPTTIIKPLNFEAKRQREAMLQGGKV